MARRCIPLAQYLHGAPAPSSTVEMRAPTPDVATRIAARFVVEPTTPEAEVLQEEAQRLIDLAARALRMARCSWLSEAQRSKFVEHAETLAAQAEALEAKALLPSPVWL